MTRLGAAPAPVCWFKLPASFAKQYEKSVLRLMRGLRDGDDRRRWFVVLRGTYLVRVLHCIRTWKHFPSVDMQPVGNGDDPERTKIREELSSMSFEQLQKLKEQLGTKVYNEAMFGQRGVKRKVFKRENKNRPREMSSKVPVPILHEVIPVKKSAPRDPRFDSLCGDFNAKAFKASYAFISEYKAKELKQLKEELKETTDDERKAQIKYLIQRMENQLREEEKQKRKESREAEEKAEIIEARKEGKQPHFRKKSEKRVVDLIDQYEELKKRGKVAKNIEKHRKKLVQKDRKKLHAASRD